MLVRWHQRSVVIDRDSNRSKGFGFVEMTTDEEARKTIEKLNGTSHEGRNITVSEAKPQVSRGGGGGGGRGGDRGRGGRSGGGGGGNWR